MLISKTEYVNEIAGMLFMKFGKMPLRVGERVGHEDEGRFLAHSRNGAKSMDTESQLNNAEGPTPTVPPVLTIHA